MYASVYIIMCVGVYLCKCKRDCVFVYLCMHEDKSFESKIRKSTYDSWF